MAQGKHLQDCSFSAHLHCSVLSPPKLLRLPLCALQSLTTVTGGILGSAEEVRQTEGTDTETAHRA